MNNTPVPLLITPHRGFFLLGISVFVLAMAWWLAAQIAPPTLIMPQSWLHAWLAVFGMLGPFIAGFLFTAYSRWLGADPPGRSCWLASLVLMTGGTLLFFAGAWLGSGWSMAGALAWLGAWVLVMGHLLRALREGGGAALHAGGMVAAAVLGLVAAGLLAGWLGTGHSALAVRGLAFAFWGFLLGVYLVVAHRMIPFFAGRVLQPYPAYRPAWILLAALALAWTHLALLLAGLPRWLWVTDGALALLALWMAWRWQWWRAGVHRLLAALFIGWAGLVAGMAASAVQHGYFFLTGRWVGVHLAEHLVGIGFFGAMVIAMGTRVTLGHSGRPLQMGATAWWALLGISLAAALRALAELLPLREPLILASAALWVGAGLAWALRHGPMLVLPRADQRPG